jgi:hypothetical protein
MRLIQFSVVESKFSRWLKIIFKNHLLENLLEAHDPDPPDLVKILSIFQNLQYRLEI